MPDTFDARREQILDLWAAGLKTADIADRIGGGVCDSVVTKALAAGRRDGDPRARKRGKYTALPTRLVEAVIGMAPTMTCVEITDALAEHYDYATEANCIRQFLASRGLKAKPAARFPRRGVSVEPPVPPRPEGIRYASLTAYLMGDPPVGRRAIDQRVAP